LSQKIENLAKILIEKNIKPSYQRIKVIEYLTAKRNHPTADEIFNELVIEIPTLSKATIYNTLNLLVEAKLARAVTIKENETRYDAKVANHGHFKCDLCGTIYDFPTNIDDLSTDSLKEFNVYFNGICPKCLNNK
jgi:Fur family peroxide stress response transcriptional regulator